MKNFKFVNAQKMHELYPKTFDVPTIEELNSLKKGDSVKVCIDDIERFWVTVTSVNNDEIIGIVDNELIDLDLKIGEEIKFKKENIYSIW